MSNTYVCVVDDDDKMCLDRYRYDRLSIEWVTGGKKGSIVLVDDDSRRFALEILTLIGDEETAAKIRMLLQ